MLVSIKGWTPWGAFPESNRLLVRTVGCPHMEGEWAMLERAVAPCTKNRWGTHPL